MICQATYDSQDAIPEALRDEFENVNGKYQLKPDAIPGVGPLFNPALHANEQRAVGQVKVRNETIDRLNAEIEMLKNQAGSAMEPGARILPPADAAAFDAYSKLGSPKDLEKRLNELTAEAEKARKLETEQSIAKAAEGTGLNGEVLAGWAATQEGVEIFTVDQEVEDPKTKQKATQKIPMARVSVKEGSTVKQTERPLLELAKERMPSWMYEALVKGAADQPAAQPLGGVRMPKLGSAQAAPAADSQEKPVDRYNKERASRPSPFTKPAAQAQ